MQLEISAEQHLLNAGVRITAVRLMIYKTIRQHFSNPFSLADVEALLPTVDRSTLFRNLNTLTQGGLLHAVDDGTNAQKYCICHCENHHQHTGHVHITCTQCHHTYCLTTVEIPPVPLPAGFLPQEHEYIVKGVCRQCRNNEK